MSISFEKLETPCYVINKEKLEDCIDSFVNAIEEIYPETILAYSYKTNYYPYVLNHMKMRGIYAEVTSEDEYYLATKGMGYTNKIIYNGPVKSKETFLEAIRNGCIVNIDSHREIEWLKELELSRNYKIGLRINFDMVKYYPKETQLVAISSRFGFCMHNEELKQVIHAIKKMKHIEINCLHMHCGANSRSLAIYECITERACEVIREYNLPIEYINMGGGYKLGVNEELTMHNYLLTIKQCLIKNSMKDVKLILEPGNSMVYPAIDYITTVIDVKKTERDYFVTLDGSRIHTEPLFRGRQYHIQINRKSHTDNIIDSQYLVGSTCKESDRFMRLKNINQIVEGDRVIFEQIGAYTMSLAPTFILAFPNVYIFSNNTYVLYAKKKDYIEMM